MKTYKWAIVGTGEIAQQLAMVFNHPNSELYAICSRNQETAERFGEKYDIPVRYGSYDELLADEAVDVVYVAVPNRFHKDYLLKALRGGKHVLCEKAITMDLAELEEVMAVAAEKNLILQEAMTIFNMPLFDHLRQLADSGKLGKLKMIQAPFGSYKEPDPTNRFFNPDLAGGALLDIGTYAVSLVHRFMNAQPQVTASQMLPFATGVDEQSVTILENELGEMAAVTLTFQAKMPKIGIIAYEKGYITIPEYPRAQAAEIFYTDGTRETIEVGETSQALNYEIANMVACIEGAPNNSLALTHDATALMDQMQHFWHAAKNS